MTYSIVARDPETGELGVAVETALPGVGRLCPWAEAGVGAVATQALVRVSHGPSGLQLMRNGFTAPEALTAVLAGDPGREVRQLAMVDTTGSAAGHTGSNTIRYAGHHVGGNYSVQANMMATDTIPGAMAAAFEASTGEPLVMRLLAALDAAQAEGGDFRGQQSAALKVVSGELHKNPWEGVLFDVRVDDHAQPVVELRRIVNRMRAYDMAGEAEIMASEGSFDAAAARIADGRALDPDDLQPRFWYALHMASIGQIERVEDELRTLFQDKKWLECALRYEETRPFDTPGVREKLIALAVK
jgi:uncharacterized Ntn-hydrolase superfamily protein